MEAGLEDDLLECLRVVQALGGVEDFDAGKMVGRVIVDGDAVPKLFRGHSRFFETDV